MQLVLELVLKEMYCLSGCDTM